VCDHIINLKPAGTLLDYDLCDLVLSLRLQRGDLRLPYTICTPKVGTYRGKQAALYRHRSESSRSDVRAISGFAGTKSSTAVEL
jgi:hypothetical protein